ncbi:MAG: sodium/proline symporter PutP [Lachnospiraceae bacterium]|nr:sodium/proline symporter PutP [Lachnospiraceae bacterium]
MQTSQICILIVIALYLIGMMAIGIAFSRKNETTSDFYLGGRKLGPFVTAMSAEASDMSSWLLMGLPGLAYLTGIADAGWTAIGLMVGTYLNWLIVATRLRKYSEANKSITIPEFFSNRYGDKRNVLTLISAVWIIVFFVPYTASGFSACGKLFKSLFNIDYHTAMIISAIVIMIYTAFGGFLAASTTDFIQSIVMTLALVIILIFGTVKAGGVSNVIDNAKSLPGYFSMIKTYNPATNSSNPYQFLNIISMFAWGLGYFGMPHILLRFMAIEDDKKIKLSRRVATVWVVISMGVSVIIGVVGLAMTSNGAIKNLQGSNSETIIVKISHLLASHGIIPACIAGIVLSGILASTMSTADSQLLAASSSVSNDILVKFFHTKLSNKVLLTISRISLILIAIAGVVLAWNPDSSVFQIVSFAWAGFGAAFGPVMLLALFWRRSNLYGAIAGMIAGGTMIFVWKFVIRSFGGFWDIYELLPAFIFALLVNVIISLLTKAPSKELTDVYDSIS